MKEVDGSKKLKRSGHGKIKTGRGWISEGVKNSKRRHIGCGFSVPSPSEFDKKDLSGSEHEDDNNAAQDVAEVTESSVVTGISMLDEMAEDRADEVFPKSAQKARADPAEIKADANAGHYSKDSARKHEFNKTKEGYSGKLHTRKATKESNRYAKNAAEVSEGSNIASRQFQKRNFQKQMMHRYSSQTHNSFGGVIQSLEQRIENIAQRMGEAIVRFGQNYPLMLLIAVVILVVIMAISGAASLFGLMLSGAEDLVMTSSFTAEDSMILRVEEDYCKLERELQAEADRVQIDMPGYDEYRISMASVTHDPVELAAYLTVLYEAYTESQVIASLYEVLNGQYDLSVDERTELRERTETRWHYVTKSRDEERSGFRWEKGQLVKYTYTVLAEYQELESYEVDVEYEYKILSITLIGQSIDEYVYSIGLSDAQLMRYELLKETKGNKPELFESL